VRRRLLAAALGLTVALAGVGVAEQRVRATELGSMRVWFDPPGIKYVLAPEGEADGRGWSPDVPPEQKDDRPRVVCLGDSVTYGVNVGPRETWCAGLRRAIPNLETVNLGMNGWDAEQVATLLETHVAAWEPELVVWGTYVNDVFPTYLLYGQITGDPVFVGTDVPEQARLLPETLALFLVRNSALFRRTQGAAYARSERTAGPSSPRPGWYEAQVGRVAAWSAETNTPVVYLAIPPHVMANMATCPDQFPVPGLCDASAAQYQGVLDALTTRGVPFVDALPAFRASGQPHFHPPGRQDPDHPNAAGHAILTAAVAPAVRAALGLPAADTANAVTDTMSGASASAESPPLPGAPPGAPPLPGAPLPDGARGGPDGMRGGPDGTRDRPTPRHPGGGKRAREGARFGDPL